MIAYGKCLLQIQDYLGCSLLQRQVEMALHCVRAADAEAFATTLHGALYAKSTLRCTSQ